MTVKDLVSTHVRVSEPWNGIDVEVHIFTAKKNKDHEVFSVDDAIHEYGHKNVKEWFETNEIIGAGQLVEINILI